MKRDIYKEISAHTDANEHTEARICATAAHKMNRAM